LGLPRQAISNLYGCPINIRLENVSAKGGPDNPTSIPAPTDTLVDNCNGNTLTYSNNPTIARYELDGTGFPHALLAICGDMMKGWCDDGTTNSLYSGGVKIWSVSDANGALSINNCQLGGISGTVSPAACGSASTGKIAIPSNAGLSYTVNTTAISAHSEIFFRQTKDNSGLPLPPTCAVSTVLPAIDQTTRVVGTSFTMNGLTSQASVTCFEYWIVN
jgi:hypothetical protein